MVALTADARLRELERSVAADPEDRLAAERLELERDRLPDPWVDRLEAHALRRVLGASWLVPEASKSAPHVLAQVGRFCLRALHEASTRTIDVRVGERTVEDRLGTLPKLYDCCMLVFGLQNVPPWSAALLALSDDRAAATLGLSEVGPRARQRFHLEQEFVGEVTEDRFLTNGAWLNSPTLDSRDALARRAAVLAWAAQAGADRFRLPTASLRRWLRRLGLTEVRGGW